MPGTEKDIACPTLPMVAARCDVLDVPRTWNVTLSRAHGHERRPPLA
jgi:hypothetical protein